MFIALKGEVEDVGDGIGSVFDLLAVVVVAVAGAVFSSPTCETRFTIGFPPHSVMISSTLGFPSVKYKIFSMHLAKTSFSNSGR